MSSSSLQTTINFLQKGPGYDSVKVYDEEGKEIVDSASEKVKLEKRKITVHDIRGREASIATNGFACMNLETGLTPEDFDETSKLVQSYLPKLSQAVKAFLGADRVQIYDYTRRKRHPEYPNVKDDVFHDDVQQPANLAHIDEVQRDVLRIMKKLNPNEFSSLSKQRWQAVIAWKPLRGPVRDWPLAVCDRRTVDLSTDLHLRDILDPDRVSDEYLLHYSPKQEWYYLQDQTPNEVWIMHQADSTGKIGVPHSAFSNPESRDTDPLRESIDVTMIVYYKDSYQIFHPSALDKYRDDAEGQNVLEQRLRTSLARNQVKITPELFNTKRIIRTYCSCSEAILEECIVMVGGNHNHFTMHKKYCAGKWQKWITRPMLLRTSFDRLEVLPES